jgi:hypothetical protein
MLIESIRRKFLLFCSIFFLTFGLFAPVADGAPKPLKYGRWVGGFKPAIKSLPLGATLDLFITQPNEVTAFPRLEALFKVALGGIQGREFHTIHFKNVNYNYQTGDFIFDEPNAEFLIEAKVSGENKIQGSVTNTATGALGALELVFIDKTASNEPCDPDEPCSSQQDPTSWIPRGSYFPLLGQTFEGACNGQRTRLELSTARFEKPSEDPQGLLGGFQVSARLGSHSDSCTGFCVERSWDNAQFDFFRSHLTLTSAQFSDDCSLGHNGELKCQLSANNRNKECQFKPTQTPDFNFKVFENKFQMNPTPEQRRALPQNEASFDSLRAALSGEFSGYLFHEKSGVYQPMQMGVNATISTDNPHNQPFVYVSGQTRLYLGRDFASPFINVRFDRRTFFASQGFTLSAEHNDVFFVIQTWTSGYISGSAYSKQHGRVGNFELSRATLSSLPSTLSPQSSVSGLFQGLPRAGALPWRFSLMPTELTTTSGLIPMNGTVQIVADGQPIPRFGISRGSYDVFSGEVAVQVKESESAERFVIGNFVDSKNLFLSFGSSSSFGTLMSEPTKNTFTRIDN